MVDDKFDAGIVVGILQRDLKDFMGYKETVIRFLKSENKKIILKILLNQLNELSANLPNIYNTQQTTYNWQSAGLKLCTFRTSVPFVN